jgi:hypothetical protein
MLPNPFPYHHEKEGGPATYREVSTVLKPVKTYCLFLLELSQD